MVLSCIDPRLHRGWKTRQPGIVRVLNRQVTALPLLLSVPTLKQRRPCFHRFLFSFRGFPLPRSLFPAVFIYLTLCNSQTYCVCGCRRTNTPYSTHYPLKRFQFPSQTKGLFANYLLRKVKKIFLIFKPNFFFINLNYKLLFVTVNYIDRTIKSDLTVIDLPESGYTEFKFSLQLSSFSRISHGIKFISRTFNPHFCIQFSVSNDQNQNSISFILNFLASSTGFFLNYFQNGTCKSYLLNLVAFRRLFKDIIRYRFLRCVKIQFNKFCSSYD